MNRTRRMIPSLAVGLVLLSGLVLGLSPRPAGAVLWPNTRDYFKVMDEKFKDVTPSQDLEEQGFAQYERYKWFTENRLDPETGNEVPGMRWRAWEQLRNLEQQNGTRSNTWFNDGPINVAGRCLAIAVHPTIPTTAYAGFASSGIWKTTDGGTTWTALDDFLPTLAISAIKIDPSNPDRIWIGTGEGWGNVDAVHGVGVMVSTDAGATWNPTAFNYAMSSGRDVYAVDYNPATGTLMIGADNGLWRSTDQGASFTQIFNLGSWKDCQLKHGSTTTWFASTHGWSGWGIYRSTDDGASFTLLTNGTPTSGILNNRFTLGTSDPNYIYWGVDHGNQTMSIYKSTDGGDSFSTVFNGTQYGAQGWYDLTISVDPTNTNNVYSGGVNFYRSTNGGVSFSGWGGNIHVDHHATAWAPSNSTNFWVGSDGGVWRSTNSGASFADRNTGLTTLQFYAINQADSRPSRASGGTQDNGTWRYDANPNWVPILGGDGFFTEFDRQHPDTCYAEIYYGQHYRSYDGGVHMYIKNSGISDQGPWSTPTFMDYANSAILWTAHNTNIYKSTNRMEQWVYQNNPTGLGGGRSIDQCRANPNVLVVVGGSKVWLTTDGGATWIDRTSGLITANTISDVACHPTDPNTFLLTCQTYSATIHQVYKTTDQGVTWTPFDSGLPDEPVNSIVIDPQNPDTYFIGTDTAVYLTQDAGNTWVPFNTGLPHVVVDDLRLHDSARLLRAGTHGRGLWEVDISNIGTDAVNQVRPTVQPLTLRVFGSPARDQALLHFGMRTPGQVKLAIYDFQGRLVRTLMNKFHYANIDNVVVNVKDLPSGVYFARLDANGAHVSQKLVVER